MPSSTPTVRAGLADVLGQLAKTDTIDARILALYGQLINPQATPVPAKALAELQELVLGRQAAIAEQTALANRFAAAESAVLKQLIKRHLGLGLLCRLRAAGKPAKLALTAVMRKLVILANTLIRDDRHWVPAHA